MIDKKLANGFSMPVFGIGTWMLGGNAQVDPNNDDARDIAAIKAGLEHGLPHIDTAEMYAAGHAEELVAEAIKGYNRDQLFIASKAWPSHFTCDAIQIAAESSLKRLKTDYLDLYMLHKPNDNIPLEETMRGLDKLVERGLVRYIGVSNFAIARLQKAQALSGNKIVVNQVHYNLISREPETSGLLEYCQQNEIILSAWRPLQKGGLLNAGILTEMSEKYGKSPAQVAINWLVSQPNLVTMSTMRSVKHLEENLGALDWQMDKNDIEKLRREFPGQCAVSPDVPLS